MRSQTRSVRLGAALLALALWLPAAHAEEAPLGATLDGLLKYAREHSPELRVRALEAEAARAGIEPAGALPDPKFQLELMDFTNSMSGGSTFLLPGEVGQTRYRVMQPLPFRGKRELRGAVAEALAGQSETMRESTTLELETRIKAGYARHYQAAGEARILSETLALVEALERLVLTRYGVGLVPQQDAVRAQSEITGLKVELVEAERRRQDAVAKLNAELARDADAALGVPQALPAGPDELVLAALYADARERSPDLARERLGIDAAAKAKDLTWLNRYPDFTVGLTNNRPKDGDNSWELMLELNIPLQQSARRAQEREAVHRLEAARMRVAAMEARVNGRLGENLAAWRASRDKARLLRDTLLPQARATLEAAQAGYESGRVNFNTLIEAERQILRTRLALLDAEVEAAVRLAELEQLVGVPL